MLLVQVLVLLFAFADNRFREPLHFTIAPDGVPHNETLMDATPVPSLASWGFRFGGCEGS